MTTITEGSSSVLTAFGLSTWVMNIFAVGSITLLWGLVNSLQIVAHFPLLSVILPGSSKGMYLMIYEIVTFDLLPMDEIEEYMEVYLGDVDNSDKH